MIYLDYNATTPLAPAALEAMRPFLERFYGNPSSTHAAGREARAAVDDARDLLAALLKAKPSEVVFTGGGTESDNLGVIGLARTLAPKGRHLITAATEHHAVLHAFQWLEKHEGFRVTYLPVDRRGMLDPEDLARAFTAETTLVSIMSANNETGVTHPVRELAALCRERGALFHSDMIQSCGKEPIAAQEFDALSIAAHKFYGPKGVGALLLRAAQPLQQIALGGSHENQRRAGTENVVGIVGMAAAAAWSHEGMAAEQARQGKLRDRLWDGIRKLAPLAICNGIEAPRLANTLNVTFPGIDAQSLLMNLDLAGICASSGSACMVGSIEPSHVLLAMGVPADLARCSIRFSLGKFTTPQEIEAVLAALPAILDRLRPEPA